MQAAQPEPGASLRRYLDRPRGGPTVLRIVLGTQLRRLREESGITREQAGDAIRASHAKISRLELGRVGCKVRDVEDLLTMYGVSDPAAREEYLALARQTSTPGWWHQYSDILPNWFETHLGLEEAASVIRTYEVQFVPGLLQTADYARSVTALGHPRATADEVERRVELRVQRQRVLTENDPPHLWAVVDEAALRRPLGSREIMTGQIRHLLEMVRLPNVTIQMAPFHLGGLAAAGGPITVLRFSEPDLPDIVYLEQLTSALYLDKRDDVDHYLTVMDRLCAQAEQPRETIRTLELLLKQLED